MPVFRSGSNQAPDWCEMEYFDIVRLQPGAHHTYTRKGRKEKLIVRDGCCRVLAEAVAHDMKEGECLELDSSSGRFDVQEVYAPTTLVRMCGRWEDETGGCGTFTVRNVDLPSERGDPSPYPKTTKLDNHYHDCDEYWIIVEGRGIAVSEGRRYDVGPGDCVATRAGDHHDFPQVFEPVKAVYLETTLRGKKRRGHLWEHTHGPPATSADPA